MFYNCVNWFMMGLVGGMGFHISQSVLNFIGSFLIGAKKG